MFRILGTFVQPFAQSSEWDIGCSKSPVSEKVCIFIHELTKVVVLYACMTGRGRLGREPFRPWVV